MEYKACRRPRGFRKSLASVSQMRNPDVQ